MMLDHNAKGWILGKVREAAESNIALRAPFVDAHELYKALMPTQRCYDTLMAAAEYVVPGEFKQMINLTVGFGDKRSFLVHLPSHPISSGGWVMPSWFRSIEHENELSHIIKPALEVATAWADLYYVFDKLAGTTVDTRGTATMFPWVKDLARDLDWDKDFEDDWMQRNHRWRICGYLGQRTTNAGLEATQRILNHMMEGGSRDMPRLTHRVSQICVSGGMLFTQWRILKEIERPERPADMATIYPYVGHDVKAPAWLKDEVTQIKEAYKEEMEEHRQEMARKRRR